MSENLNKATKVVKENEKTAKKLSVLMGMDVYLPDVDGVVNCMHNYSLCLEKDHKVTAIAPQHKEQAKVKTPYKIIRCKSRYLPILRDHYGRPKKDKKFKEQVYAQNYDIVHVHSPFAMSEFALEVAHKQNIPAVITFHTNIKPIIKNYAKFNFLTKIILKQIGKIYNRYDKVFVISDLVTEQVRECGYTGEIEKLPFGTDLIKATDKEIEANRERANKEFKLLDDELVFLYVGRVVKLKRIDFTLRALAKLKQKGIKFKFFVVGKGSALEKLQKLSKKLGLSDDVVFTGFLERELLPVINARADLLLFPSLYDNFGLVKVEAAAYNTPGVFVGGSCAGDGVQDGINGFLCKNDVESYCDTIARAVANLEKLKKVGKCAGETIYISWQDCTDKLCEAYHRIIEERKNKEL